MRPIKLTMKAFGSYAQKTEIEFTLLGNEGVYLITGDTGSGKTTIFDAIVFALYGQSSGEYRDKEMFRSRYVKDDERSSVELEFECLGKRYKITRTLTTTHKKKNDEKTESVNSTATLEFSDGRAPLEKLTLVNEEIVKILGLTYEQFKQIIMLAQGEFRKLLFSNSKAKSDILRKLLNTGIYESFQKKISKRSSDKENELKKDKAIAVNDINSIDPTDAPEIETLIANINKSKLANLSDVDELLKLLSNDLNKSNINIKTLKENALKARENYDEINQKRTIAEKNNGIFDQITLLQKQLPDLENNANSTRELAEKMKKKNDPQIEETTRSRTLIEDSLSDYDTLDKLTNDMQNLVNDKKSKEAEHANCIDNLSKNKASLNELKSEYENYKDVGENIATLNAKIEKIMVEGKKIASVIEDVSAYEKLFQEYTAAMNDYKSAKASAKALRDTATSMRQQYNDEQAGILAANLKEGVPCPVCGAVHHPAPAKKSPNAPTKEEVEAADAKAKKAEETENECSSRCADLNGRVENKKEAINKELENLGIDRDIESSMPVLNELRHQKRDEFDQAKNNLTQEEVNKKRKEEIDKLIPNLDNSITELNKKIAELENNITALDAKYGEKEKRFGEIKSKMKFDGKAAAQTEIANLNRRIAELNSLNTQTEEKAKNAAKDFESAQTTLKALSKQLPDDYVKANLDELNNSLQQAQNEEKSIADILNNATIRADKNLHAFKTLNTNLSDLKEKERKHALLEDLSKLATGNSGKNMKLETFYQSESFKNILSHANLRFDKMSDERYEMIIKEETNGGQSDQTLCIDIRDHYTGKTRDVKSLSGGESFIASLSLALGLSDAVQQNAGGIQMETMFVDEGFGSLDNETLRHAMDALTDLSANGRLVGIISHVDELKKTIQKQIRVHKKDGQGSTVDIVVD